MGNEMFKTLVIGWLEELKKDLLINGDYKIEDFEAGGIPEIDYFEVYWDDVLGDKQFATDMHAAIFIREMIPKHLIMVMDAEMIVECGHDDALDLGYMYRCSTSDAFRLYLQCEFATRFCEVTLDNFDPQV